MVFGGEGGLFEPLAKTRDVLRMKDDKDTNQTKVLSEDLCYHGNGSKLKLGKNGERTTTGIGGTALKSGRTQKGRG